MKDSFFPREPQKKNMRRLNSPGSLTRLTLYILWTVGHHWLLLNSEMPGARPYCVMKTTRIVSDRGGEEQGRQEDGNHYHYHHLRPLPPPPSPLPPRPEKHKANKKSITPKFPVTFYNAESITTPSQPPPPPKPLQQPFLKQRIEPTSPSPPSRQRKDEDGSRSTRPRPPPQNKPPRDFPFSSYPDDQERTRPITSNIQQCIEAELKFAGLFAGIGNLLLGGVLLCYEFGLARVNRRNRSSWQLFAAPPPPTAGNPLAPPPPPPVSVRLLIGAGGSPKQRPHNHHVRRHLSNHEEQEEEEEKEETRASSAEVLIALVAAINAVLVGMWTNGLGSNDADHRRTLPLYADWYLFMAMTPAAFVSQLILLKQFDLWLRSLHRLSSSIVSAVTLLLFSLMLYFIWKSFCYYAPRTLTLF